MRQPPGDDHGGSGPGLLAGAARSEFVRASAGPIALRAASLALVFASHLLLTRALGVRGYGMYAYSLAWLNALAVPATLGTERLVVRQVAVYHARADWQRWRGLLSWAGRSVATASLSLAALAAAGAWLIAGEAALTGGFWIAMLLLPIVAATRLAQYVLQGMHLPERGLVSESILHPLILVVLLAVAQTFPGALSVAGAMGLNLVGGCAALVCAAVLAGSALPGAVRAAAPREEEAVWSRSIGPLVLVSGTQALNGQLPVLMAGAILGLETAGILALAKRLADLTVLPAIAAGAALTPALARHWAARDIAGFQRTLTGFARGVTLLGGGLALVLIACRHPILTAFGPSFARGAGALVLICAGHVFNIMAGSLSLALVMTEHERRAAGIAAAATLLNLVLCATLIPRWGIEGAAGAGSLSLVAWNCWLAASVWRLLGIRPTILARIPDAHSER